MKKFILFLVILVCLCSFVSAATVNDVVETTAFGSHSKSGFKGFYWTAPDNFRIGNITLNTSCITATRVLVLDNNQALLKNSTIFGEQAEIDYNFTAGSTYHLVIHNDGSAFTSCYLTGYPSSKGGWGYVEESGRINYTGRNNEGVTDTEDFLDGGWLVIETTDQIVGPSVSISLLSPADNTITNNLNRNFTYNYSYNKTSDVCQLWTNTTGTWTNTTDLYTPTMNTTLGFYQTFTDYDNILWNIGCNFTDTNLTFTNNNRTLNLTAGNIDNCTTYSMQWVNFTIRDELTNNVINSTVTYYYSYLGDNYSGTMGGRDTYNFCMFPSDANFTTNITFQYQAPGYSIRDYIQQNYRVDNSSENVDLYLLGSSNSTPVTIHVIDSQDIDLSNVLIEAYKWDIDTDTDLLVETETTDSNGEAIFDLKIGTEYYSFKFYQNGALQLATNRFKIFTTTLEYVLTTTETSRLQEWLEINQITRTLTYSNNTNIVTFDWSDPNNLADNFCLNVTSTNGTSFYNGCSTTSPLTYTISLFNVSYVAQGSARYSGGSNWYILGTLSIDERVGFRGWFGNGVALVMGFIIFIVISMLALVNKNIAIIGAMFGSIALYFFGVLPGLVELMGIIVIGAILLVVMNKRYNG